MWSWRPAFIGYYDTSPYVTAAHTKLFSDPFRPAGYPTLLSALHALSDRVVAVTVLQHCLGLATALMLFAAVRGVANSPWAALVAPAVVLLDGFEVLVEHAVLSDSLFVFLLAAALLATLRARRAWSYALAAGALIALAATVRTVGLFVAPLVLLAVLWPERGRWKAGLRRLTVAALAAAAVLAAYAQAERAQVGATGLSRAPGWSLYARIGQFADCRRFRAPAGTERLCERVPPARRPSTDFYFWARESPAQRAFGAPPRGDQPVGRFARAALAAQPADYVGTVVRDFARYVWPERFRRPRAGQTQAQYIAQAQDPHELRFVRGELARYYAAVPRARRRMAGLTIGYVAATEVSGALLVLLLVLAAAAPLVARGDGRRAATLLAATALVLLLVPVATQVYDARYAVAALGPLSAAAALGLDAGVPLAIRRARRRRAIAAPVP
jgi:4-amino-4-deoxy-L-arabinose transferase-like glycosyltransferase